MSLILCLETSTKVCSVALFKENNLIDFEEAGGAYSHAENLALFVDRIMQRQGLSYSELNAVAVTKGPGSYTGLRIGVSLAKGIAYGANIPLIAIDSLASLAYGAIQKIKDDQALYCSMIDARRMEVYTSIYNAKLEEVQGIEAKVIDSTAYSKLLSQQKIYFYGDGAAKCESTLEHPQAVFIELQSSAKNMGALAFEAYDNKSFEDVAYFEPFYLKEFVALQSKKKLV